jgi:hypothetical protein
MPSFRGDAQHRTRNLDVMSTALTHLELPGSSLRDAPE